MVYSYKFSQQPKKVPGSRIIKRFTTLLVFSCFVNQKFWICFLVLQATLATTDTSCESVVTSGQHHLTPQHPPKDASPAGLVWLLLLVSQFLFLWSTIALWFYVLWDCVVCFQTYIHCRGDFNRVSFEGYWNCCGVGPNARDEGNCSLSWLSLFILNLIPIILSFSRKVIRI